MKGCEICHESTAKYKCPGCLVQTCSLPCVKQHKANSGCSGQRDKTAYVAMKDFTDLNLLSDYRFLEDAGRKKDGVYRDRLRKSYDLPSFVQQLKKQANIRKINLRLMPYPMTRRKGNFTRFNFKSRNILWQIEWCFPQADTKILDKLKPETSTLESLLDVHTGDEGDPVVKHKLRPYTVAGKKDWRLFLKVEDVKASEIRYHVLDMSKSITENLANKTVIEYPSIHVVLRNHWKDYATVGTEILSEDSANNSIEGMHSGEQCVNGQIPEKQSSKLSDSLVNQSQEVT